MAARSRFQVGRNASGAKVLMNPMTDELWSSIFDAPPAGAPWKAFARRGEASQLAYTPSSAPIGACPGSLNGGLAIAAGDLDLSAGGNKALTVDLGSFGAGFLYWIVAGLAGCTPGLPIITPQGQNTGFTLPVNEDPEGLLQYTILHPNDPALLPSLGFTGANGQATCTVTIPAATDPNLAGYNIHFAAMIFQLVGAQPVLLGTTNAVIKALVA